MIRINSRSTVVFKRSYQFGKKETGIVKTSVVKRSHDDKFVNLLWVKPEIGKDLVCIDSKLVSKVIL